MTFTAFALYILPLVIILSVYLRRKRHNDRRQHARLSEAVSSGMTEPPSLHPVVDNAICVGSGGCARACPEHALGIVKGKAVLVDPTKCIGHGACAAACPVDAISLVFGTEKRGMDIPEVNPNFETNVPGIYIAGELGGMGLIRKAVAQGQQAIDSIVKSKKISQGDELDVLIVGAGSAGVAASLAAKEKKLRYVTIEQEDGLGGTVYHYPRNKIAMTAPMHLPLVGIIKAFEISKEELLGLWNRIMQQTKLDINFNERMEKIEPDDKGFRIQTTKNSYHARNVLLAIGRRGTPRKLNVPGEEQAKVVYRLIDAEQYKGMHVLVVGGGDSALEAAIAIANEADTTVTLSYRAEAFSRVKEKNRKLLEEAASEKKINVLLKSNVIKIDASNVTLDYDGESLELPNDGVIVCAGGVLPTPFLKEIGVMVKTHYGTKAV